MTSKDTGFRTTSNETKIKDVAVLKELWSGVITKDGVKQCDVGVLFRALFRLLFSSH